MAGFREGDIVLITHAPFSDQTATKMRPALVISADRFNQDRPDVICAAISSRLREGDPYRVDIEGGTPYFGETGLHRSSTIKCWAMFAYQADKIRRRLGRLPPPLMEDVKAVLREILGV